MDKRQERQAVFWCSLLRPVLYGEIPRGRVAAYLREVCQAPVRFPDGQVRRPSLRTLKRKLKTFGEGGFDALARKPRRDRGKPRAASPGVIRAAVEAKCEQPRRSAVMINHLLEQRYGKTLPRSTLFRHLKAAGATRRKLGVVQEPVRKRWTWDHTHDMWVGDFAHGPCVLAGGTSMRTRLSAFIDVHSRFLVAGRYYLKENLDILCDTLIRAFGAHGIPRALYLDNAKVYHAQSLKAACYRLHVNLLHRPPRDPAPGGLIERFFATVQGQFESEVRAGQVLSLARLNQAFDAWLDVVYHATVHSETKETPAARYASGRVAVRQADMEAVAESFLQSERRTVDKTFSDVRLHGGLFRVDKKLRGDRVEVRYDPFGRGTEVLLYSQEGVYLGKGVRHEREQGEKARPSAPVSARSNVLDILIDKQQKRLEEETVDFAAASTARPWPFQAFAAAFAELLGRKGGLTSFAQEELAALRAVHARFPKLTRSLLKRAFGMSERKTIPAIVYALQTLMHKET